MSIYDNTVKDGELLKWDTVGKVVEGLYLNYRAMPNTGKGPGNVYEIHTKDGVISFFAPSLLQNKLKNIPKGALIRIEYIKEGKTKTGNTLKEFDVQFTLDGVAEKLKGLGIKTYDNTANDGGASDQSLEDFTTGLKTE